MLKSNLSVVPPVIPPLSQEVAGDWEKYLKSLPTRTSVCPVRKHAGINNGLVDEYLVDIFMIQKDNYHQNRFLGALANKVSELANQLHTCAQGLKVGICVALGPNGNLVLRWGNHRLRATEQNNQNNLTIQGMPTGKIWASIYDLPTSEIRKWQALENNLHDISSPATKDDNVLSLKEMVADGVLDKPKSKFVDCDDREKDKRLKGIIRETMPHWSTSSKVRTLISAYRRQNTNVYRVDSYTSAEMKKYFRDNCPLPGALDFELYTGSPKNIVKSVLPDGSTRLTKVLFSHFHGASLGGAVFQSAIQDKIVEEVCDETVLISCHNGTPEKSLVTSRRKREKWVKLWNKALSCHGLRIKAIDKIFVLPQTTLEKKGRKFITIKSL
jgi:hypothetical protein